MNLSDQFQQAADRSVDDSGIDLDRLGRVARTQGTRARRARRGVTVLGSAAAVTVLALGGSTLLHSGPHTLDRAFAGQPGSQPAFDPADTGSFTGRGATAALVYAVTAEEDGSASAFAGQGHGGPDSHEVFGTFAWKAGDGLGDSVLEVNVQDDTPITTCDAEDVKCSTTDLPGGARLTTYEEHDTVSDGVGIRRVADLMRADGTRVVVSASNGYELAGGKWDLRRSEPPLSLAQLTDVVEQSWWGTTLPTYFLDEGSRLPGYDDRTDHGLGG